MRYGFITLRKKVQEILPDIISLRHRLHQYPELSEKEEETSRLIAKYLLAWSIPYIENVAGYGIVATISGKNKNLGIAIRADIDALPLQEETNVPFKSQYPGVMHACGHDIHTAILLGTGKILHEMRSELLGSVKLFFQPSEETIGGSKQMIEAGCLKNPKISKVIALHANAELEVGKVSFTEGVMNAASCEFEVIVNGKTSHGAHPEKGVDTILPTCLMISGMQSMLHRIFDPVEPVLISIGKLSSGTKNNIVSDKTCFSGIIRTMNTKSRKVLKNYIRDFCTSIATAHGASCQFQFIDSYPELINDPQLQKLVHSACVEVLGKENVLIQNMPSLGADDFSYFCHGDTKGVYYNLGVKSQNDSHPSPLHSTTFNPDEKAIEIGILTQVSAVFNILEKEFGDE